MRAFVLVGHTQPLEGDFSLDDLPGSAGRLDVLCRNLTAALLLSHDIRRDVTVWIVIRDTVTIEVRGDEVRQLRPDERSTGALLRGALETAAERAVSTRPVESSPGISVRRQGLAPTLDMVQEEYPLIRLDREGSPLSSMTAPTPTAFVLSDHEPLSADELASLDERDAAVRSVGPRMLHGDQAIAVAHTVLDRGEESGYSGTPEV